MKAYIDLNIFDRLEKIDRLDEVEKPHYKELSSMLLDKTLTTAYSNAHLNDLFRGYQKNPSFIDGHLENIKLYTNNLCICQYWGQNDVTWHYREIRDFFDEKLTDWEFEPNTYEELFEDEPLLKSTVALYKLIPLPLEFKKGYSAEQFWGIMFPLSKIHNTQYALQADIFNFQSRLKSDYGLYKSFRSKLLNSLNRVKNNKEIIKSVQTNLKDTPKHLELMDIFDAYTPNNKTSDNIMYSKVLDIFFKYDFAGYKSDGHFNNMFDDALHTFYASHFDFFLTNDDRCKYKAEKTFEKLNIKTKVLKIEEIEIIRNCL
ncbi:hypothetical protein M8998_05465 [Sphingobacterium sp. lm-10]|uniref:hypothetical protein n=1 Tax=Sphingobacterium sp. lm-10 TaxID=2944904 RepID=UPI00201FFEAD|nr:hypothetical protein [Sphingobacterium sp. lm-10]MCL7987385.1 hypothetical protein [Sphingobacterium sp. lm-10]